MAKTAHFWRVVGVGLLLGILLVACSVGFWIWEHHMFVLGITNRAAMVGGLGLIAVLILLGVAIGRVTSSADKGKLDA